MRVVVTGAAGRLGRHVCDALVEMGMDVIGADRQYVRDTDWPIRMIDLLDEMAVYPLVEGADAVVHLGNHPHMGAGAPARVYLENVQMNYNVFTAAHAVGASRIIFSSSIQTFASEHRGSDTDVPSRLPYLPLDGDIPADPANVYGLSKANAEQMLRMMVEHQNLPSAVAIRFPYLATRERFESGRLPRDMANRWLSRIRTDEGFTLLQLPDAAQLIGRILQSDLPGYRCYLPASPMLMVDISIREAIETYYPDVPVRQPLDDADCLVDNSRITEETGWTPAPVPTADVE